MTHRIVLTAMTGMLMLAACGPQSKEAEKATTPKVQAEAQQFLDEYQKTYQDVYTKSSEQEWLLNTHIVDGDSVAEKEYEAAQTAFADFTGSEENIAAAKKFLADADSLTPLQKRQFDAILFMAAASPATAADIVKEKIAASAKQVKDLFGFAFHIGKKEVSTNDIDNILSTSKNEKELLEAWNASKEVGKGLKDGVENLRNLRNRCVQELQYPDFFSYQVSEYGMSSQEMTDLCHRLISELWPLYRELHTWARYQLAAKFNKPVPDMIPAHWLPNRWGQAWGDLVHVEGLDVDKALKDKTPEWIVKQGESFYMSLGYDQLPQSFWEKSSLYPLPEGTPYKKNNHASAWHINLDKDLRSLMSVEANAHWWETVLHELGHIYYYKTYSTPEVPLLLRAGANRAYHEAMGSLLGLASMQKPFLVNFGLVDANAKTDSIQILLREALDNVVFIPFSAGTMTMFEHDLYADNLPKDQFNARWWSYVKQFQGIVPPTDRGEEYCDAASKTHINDDPGQYYDYALSYILMYQFHDHIAKQILHQDPHATNYFGNKEVGAFLKEMMKTGATMDWREHIQKYLGSEMSAKPMLEYFAPLLQWLKEQNKGRTYTLPEQI
ncbi:MAG: M2 family metallopeptidase [Flavobacteriales bacterium]|nr:M2 family metallopeptidase [Flavobacteriales bacterium]MCB9447873.1 M2 family metallopeptidase [Flavobacteriales bacterium]